MPRPPNPHAKTKRLVLEGTIEEESVRIRAFKKICVADGLQMKKELLDLLDFWLKKHNWPPGNPQTLLHSFGVQTKITQQCQYPNCEEIATHECIPNSPYAQKKVFYCQKHHDHAKESRLLKASKRL